MAPFSELFKEGTKPVFGWFKSQRFLHSNEGIN
jgi:hypothetical protein